MRATKKALSHRLYSERVKKAVRSELDNRIPAMRVRSRPDERHGKHARTDSVSCLERVFLTGKRHGQPFRQDSGRGNNDTRYRLPTRQMGWPTLGCNQQDPRRASERLSSKSLLPAWFPKRRGRAANRRIRIKPISIQTAENMTLTANPCGAETCAASVCRQPLGV